MTDSQRFHERGLIRIQSRGTIAAVLGHDDEIAEASIQLARAPQESNFAACVEMTDPALIADATGNRRIHDYHVSRFETRYLFPNVCYDRAALMTNTKGETHDLIPDSSLCVNSADRIRRCPLE
jgi:hypothetical protein